MYCGVQTPKQSAVNVSALAKSEVFTTGLKNALKFDNASLSLSIGWKIFSFEVKPSKQQKKFAWCRFPLQPCMYIVLAHRYTPSTHFCSSMWMFVLFGGQKDWCPLLCS